jgi:pimeloyl-ACP methyl ester carboxylesterase
LHIRETKGDGALVLALHGFPDDSRIYDRLAPYLSPRRVVALDFGVSGTRTVLTTPICPISGGRKRWVRHWTV